MPSPSSSSAPNADPSAPGATAGADSAPGESHATGPSLIAAAILATAEKEQAERSTLDQFLAAHSVEKALTLWLRTRDPDARPTSGDQLVRMLNTDVGRIDTMVSRQVNEILHAPRLQKLEASWQGLRYLVQRVDPEEQNIKIRVLNVTWKALVRDLDRSIEFDQNQLFRKVYSSEFGTSGGEPFSVMIGDFEIRPHPEQDSPTDDVSALRMISQVAAAAFCPFVTGAAPSMLGLDEFAGLQRPVRLADIYEQPEFLKWRSLRQTEDSRFLALVMPRIVLRLPYRDDGSRQDGFRFHEDVMGADRSRYLWGNASYAMGAVLIRAFTESRWLADIRGVRQGEDVGGLVSGLPNCPYGTDTPGISDRCSTDVMITDMQDQELSDLGFIPLCHCPGTLHAAFYSNATVQKPVEYDEQYASTNARISSMLQYVLCVSRFAHYIKVLGREKIGSFAEPQDCESYLNEWLQRYITQDDDAPLDLKARYPLRDASAEVREQPGRPGSYACTIHLQPHYQLDGMVSAVKLSTELSSAAHA